MTAAEGKQFIRDSGFEVDGNGGSAAWGVPPIDGFERFEYPGTRDDFIAFLGFDALEVRPLFEDWQRTPGWALYGERSGPGQQAISQIGNRVVEGSVLRLKFGKKIVSSGGSYGAFMRLTFRDANEVPTGQCFAGNSDSDVTPGSYSYEYDFETPPDSVTVDAEIIWFGDSQTYVDDVTLAIVRGVMRTEVGGWLYEALQPVVDPYDEARGFPLLSYVDAIGGMFQPMYDIVRDPNILLDPDRTPPSWFPWLGQLVGVRTGGETLPGETDSNFRLRVGPAIKNPPHRRRGTVSAIVEEVQTFLESPKTVYTVERVGGNMYVGSIGVVNSQLKAGVTIAKIQARIEEIAPAGRLITVTGLSDAPTWEALKTTHADWADVLATFDSWDEVRTNPTLT